MHSPSTGDRPVAAAPTREVVFALLPKVVLLDVAGPADAFRNAAQRAPGSYRLRFVAPEPSVLSAAGLSLGALEPLPAHFPPGTILVLTGLGGDWIDAEEPLTQRLIEWLRSGAAQGTLLMCVCGGQHPCCPRGTSRRTRMHDPSPASR